MIAHEHMITLLSHLENMIIINNVHWYESLY